MHQYTPAQMLIYTIICTPVFIYVHTYTHSSVHPRPHIHTAVHPYISTHRPISHPYSCTRRSITPKCFITHIAQNHRTSHIGRHTRTFRVQPLALHKCPNPAPESTAHAEGGVGSLSAQRPPRNNAFDCHLSHLHARRSNRRCQTGVLLSAAPVPPSIVEQSRTRQASHSTGRCRSQSQHNSSL